MRYYLCLCLIAGLALPAAAKDAQTPLPRAHDIRPVVSSSVDDFLAPAALVTAQAHYDAENFPQAYVGFRDIILRDPNHRDARIGLGNSALALGRTAQAYGLFTQLAKDPYTPAQKGPIVAGLVLTEIAQRTDIDVEVRINDALEITLDDPRLWNALGRFHDTAGNSLIAQDAYVRALETGRAASSVVNNLGMSYLMRGDLALAKAKFEQAILLNKDKKLYDNNRRLVLALEGHYEKAAQGLGHTRTADILNDAGYIAMQRGENRTAEILFRKAADISPAFHLKAKSNLETLKHRMRKTPA